MIDVKRDILDKYAPDLLDILDKSVEEKVEYGISFCKVDDEIKISEPTKGTLREVILRECDEGELIGEYHTHVGELPPEYKEFEPFPGPEDITNAFLRNLEVICVGHKKDDWASISCIEFNKESDEYSFYRNNYLDIFNKLLTLQNIVNETKNLTQSEREVINEFWSEFTDKFRKNIGDMVDKKIIKTIRFTYPPWVVEKKGKENKHKIIERLK